MHIGEETYDAMLEDAKQTRAEIARLRAALAESEQQRDMLAGKADDYWNRSATLEVALLDTAHALGSDGWCWCSYTRLIHPPNDPQDAVEVEENGHCKECNAVRTLLGKKAAFPEEEKT